MVQNERILRLLDRIRISDEKLGEELDRLLKDRREVAVVEEAPSGPGRLLSRETIVLRSGRPVLAISEDKAELLFRDDDSRIWKERLTAAQALLTSAIRAVGRVEVAAHPDYSWLGTGWLVDDDIIVTNRHVAMEFGRWSGDGFVFRSGTFGRTMAASVDFLAEAGRTQRHLAPVRSILHIEGEDGPDLAFLRVDTGTDRKIGLSEAEVRAKQLVAVIGYPARDSRIPEPALMTQIFGDVYDKKRLAPGQINAVSSAEVQHDCSTLGGNSGSVVLELDHGNAVGLHFAGRFLESNYAVPASIIAERLHEAKRGEGCRRFSTSRLASGSPSVPNPMRVSFNVPIDIVIEIGSPVPLSPQDLSTTVPPASDDPPDQDQFASERPNHE